MDNNSRVGYAYQSIIWIICASNLFIYSDACNSNSARIVTPPPASTTIASARIEDCPYDKAAEYDCLNDGQCIMTVFLEREDEAVISCRCSKEYIGEFCQNLKPPTLNASSSIAAGVSGAVLLIIIVIVAVCVIKIRQTHKRNKNSQPHRSRSNGYATTPNTDVSSPDGVELLQLHSGNMEELNSDVENR